MGIVLDVYNSDAFSLTTTMNAIDLAPYVPRRVSDMGIFNEFNESTTTVQWERRQDPLELLMPRLVGEDPNALSEVRRDHVTMEALRYPVEGRIWGASLQRKRRFGTDTEFVDATTARNREIFKQARALDATEELLRLGALQGIVKNADGTTAYDLFDEFGVSQPTEVALDLANTDGQTLRSNLDTIIRDMHQALLGNRGIDGLVGAVVGDTHFDLLKNHADVMNSYERFSVTRDVFVMGQLAAGQPGDFLRMTVVFQQFVWNGILWMNYRVPVGQTQWIDADTAHYFPMGIPDLFQTVYCPDVEYLEFVNTDGFPRYSLAFMDDRERWIDVYSSTVQLNVCTQPQVLYQSRSGT